MRVLILTHRLPYAPNRGDRIRSYYIVRALASRMDVELVSLVHDHDELSQVDRLRQMNVSVSAFQTSRLSNLGRAALALPTARPLTHALLDAPGLAAALKRIVRDRPPDVVLSYCSGMARFATEPPLVDLPLVLDMVDVDSEKWSALAGSSRWPKRWIYQREARCLGRFERSVTEQAATTLVVSEREGRSLQQLSPHASVRVMANGIDLSGFRPLGGPTNDPVVVFCGVMNYEPNVDGVLWFVREVWPIVTSRHPDARFVVVGSDPVAAIRQLASRGIEVTGKVPDVREYLWRSAVSVAPLLTARGLQNKVLEALAGGLPTVVTTQVLSGLPDQARGGCRAADSPTMFAEETLALLSLSGAERRAIAGRSDLSTLSWDSQLEPLPGVLANAIARGIPARGSR